MLMAKMENGRLVTATHALEKADNYFCPGCQKGVYLKKGPVMRPHFAHFQAQACRGFSEGETAEHLEGKLQLREWLVRLNVRVEMEAYLPELKQRPDLLVVKGERRIAVEFQCSGLPIEQVVARTRGYRAAGIEVVWVLGAQLAGQKKLTALQKACLSEWKGELVLFHYSVEKERLEVWGDFRLNQRQRMMSQKKTLLKGGVLGFELVKAAAKKERINYEIEHQKMVRQFQGPRLRGFQKDLYERGESAISLPKEVFARCPREWLIQEHPLEWKMAFIWWLEGFSRRTVVSERMLLEWSRQLTYCAIPQMTEAQGLVPLLEFVDILTASGVLKKFRFDKWTLVEYPKRFKHLEEKLK